MHSHSTLKRMSHTKGVFAVLVMATQLAAAKTNPWLEVKSPHFVVATNGSEKQGRHAADQFERIRAVFQKLLPHMHVDPTAPIVVLAVKDEKTFNSLTPEFQKKGQLKRSGLFLSGPEKSYVLLRLDAEGDNPYHVLYHEYTHLLIHEAFTVIPLWLDEGMAEFYGNSEIRGKDVLLGKPDIIHLQLLNQNSLLPLSLLFTVTHDSPYYNEDTKGNMFYAESWAMTHFLMFQQRAGGKNPLQEYLTLLSQEVDPLTAATRAFGDLKVLQNELQSYIRQSSMKQLLSKGSTEVDEDEYKVRQLSSAEEKTLQGDFLAHNQQYSLARDLLGEAMQEDPANAQAAESMGFLEFREGHNSEAKKWFEQAVKQNSQSYLAHYYYAVLNMQSSVNSGGAAQVENSLLTATKINPDFAPALDALAVFYTIRGEKLDDAHTLSLRAVSLEPGNIRYRLNAGNVLLRMNQVDNAARVGTLALAMAQKPEDKAAAQNFVSSVRQYQNYLATVEQRNRELKEAQEKYAQAAASVSPPPAADSGDRTGPPVLRRREAPREETLSASETTSPPQLRHRAEDSRGPSDSLVGKIVSVKCSSPAEMDLTFQSGDHTVALHSANYFNVQYSALNFTPTDVLEPCSQIQGMKARISFFHVQGQYYSGEIIAVQLRK